MDHSLSFSSPIDTTPITDNPEDPLSPQLRTPGQSFSSSSSRGDGIGEERTERDYREYLRHDDPSLQIGSSVVSSPNSNTNSNEESAERDYREYLQYQARPPPSSLDQQPPPPPSSYQATNGTVPNNSTRTGGAPSSGLNSSSDAINYFSTMETPPPPANREYDQYRQYNYLAPSNNHHHNNNTSPNTTNTNTSRSHPKLTIETSTTTPSNTSEPNDAFTEDEITTNNNTNNTTNTNSTTSNNALAWTTTPEALSSSPIWNHDLTTNNTNTANTNGTAQARNYEMEQAEDPSSHHHPHHHHNPPSAAASLLEVPHIIESGGLMGGTPTTHPTRQTDNNTTNHVRNNNTPPTDTIHGRPQHHQRGDDQSIPGTTIPPQEEPLSYRWMHEGTNRLVSGYRNGCVVMPGISIRPSSWEEEEGVEAMIGQVGRLGLEPMDSATSTSTIPTTRRPVLQSCREEDDVRIGNGVVTPDAAIVAPLLTHSESKKVVSWDDVGTKTTEVRFNSSSGGGGDLGKGGNMIWKEDVGTRSGPNPVMSLLARETTGKLPGGMNKRLPILHRLQKLTGPSLYNTINTSSSEIGTEVILLRNAIDAGNWAKTTTIISRLAPRLSGDQNSMRGGGGSTTNSNSGRTAMGRDEPPLPPNTSQFYAGGSRIGLERDIFVHAGGIQLLIRLFSDPAIVGGRSILQSNDARTLDTQLVSIKLADCWKETLVCLRELAYAIPELVDEESDLLDGGKFLPFLFTLLSHSSCFDYTASLIEEVLSIQSQGPTSSIQSRSEGGDGSSGMIPLPPTTFSLSAIPELYSLWGGFTCRQLAHFSRILALLVFEPEDRQHMECPTVPQSVELLQLRRDRVVRAGQEAIVDQNQSIVLGDERIVARLLDLLRVMNFAPELSKSSSYHMMTHFPCVGDTLRMLGMNEIKRWEDISILEGVAKRLMDEGDGSVTRRGDDVESSTTGGATTETATTTETTTKPDGEPMQHDEYHHLRSTAQPKRLNELGTISAMLDIVASLFTESEDGPTTGVGQFVQIIHIINAAQLTGVVHSSGTRTRQRERRSGGDRSGRSRSPPLLSSTGVGGGGRDNGMFGDGDDATNPNNPLWNPSPLPHVSDHHRHHSFSTNSTLPDPIRAQQEALINNSHTTAPTRKPSRHRIHQAQDAANELQFNAFILSSFQVEVLFVLCTLLGGRRKVDAQRILARNGVIKILDDMFDRLSWGKSGDVAGSRVATAAGASGGAAAGEGDDGVHGPGCDCNPEKALRIQYLRLLHNFCDRECDSHTGRRQLLSPSEQTFISSGCNHHSTIHTTASFRLHPGLLTKLITAFRLEPEDSDCRFWLATCSESWLRGSSPKEQTFCAKSGLLRFLVEYVLSNNQLYCSGRLQTAFDLLGELCKGNTETLGVLLEFLDGDRFERLMNVAVSHLVDSNVFIRALLLSVERILASDGGGKFECEHERISDGGDDGDISAPKGFLTHTWWDIPSLGETAYDQLSDDDGDSCCNDYDEDDDEEIKSEWFSPFTSNPSRSISSHHAFYSSDTNLNNKGRGGHDHHLGWRFDPQIITNYSPLPRRHMNIAFQTDIFDRLARFLIINQAYLLKELLNEVDLRKINHENICCLNTAILISVFAFRRGELPDVVKQLRTMNKEAATGNEPGGETILTKFRELLWFWSEYYSHRGRDRLSLEFSSHLRFREWKHVVDLLCADNMTSSTCLTSAPIRLPKSPYRRAPRVIGMFRTL